MFEQQVQPMDELRVAIWDLLYRAEDSKSIDEIAELTQQDDATIRVAVDHEWFTVTDAIVAISHDAPKT